MNALGHRQELASMAIQVQDSIAMQHSFEEKESHGWKWSEIPTYSLFFDEFETFSHILALLLFVDSQLCQF